MILRIFGKDEIIPDIFSISFYKNLPENMAQDYEIAKNLSNILSLKTVLKNLSIVDDVEAEYNAILEEKTRSLP